TPTPVTVGPFGANLWSLGLSASETAVLPAWIAAMGTATGSHAAVLQPSGSAPSPIPGGGASPAGAGAAGLAFSIFRILAGLSVLGGPWTRRRLRLQSEPRWPAPFVLMPERPG